MHVNVITYLYTSLKYGLSMSAMQGIQVGGFNPLYVYYYHEYYRLITANFIHFGLMHIFCNVSQSDLSAAVRLLIRLRR